MVVDIQYLLLLRRLVFGTCSRPTGILDYDFYIFYFELNLKYHDYNVYIEYL
jgi:hypothetical protein